MTHEQPTTLSAAAAEINRLRRRHGAWALVLRISAALALGWAVNALWSLVAAVELGEQLALGGLAFSLALLGAGFMAASERQRGKKAVSAPDIALAMEMRHGQLGHESLTSKAPGAAVGEAWAQALGAHVASVRRAIMHSTQGKASALAIPLILAGAYLPASTPSLKLALSKVSKVVSYLGRGATLQVVQGAVSEADTKPIPLSASRPVELELLAQNLVELRVKGGPISGAAPVVELRRPMVNSTAGSTADMQKSGLFQSFQMALDRAGGESMVPSSGGGGGGDASASYILAVAISENLDLYVPTLAADKPLVHLKVHQLPIPRVTLKASSDLEDPWPDDQPLVLKVQVEAEQPLQTVRLLIKSGNRLSKELVANVMAEDRLNLVSDYRLLLEPYVENDLDQVEVVAEAVDRSVPVPLVGYSEPIRLNTSSAYGRYRMTLQTLRELKGLIDEAVGKQDKALPPAAAKLAEKAIEQSDRSPFFDGLDRVQVHRFAGRVEDLAASGDHDTAVGKIFELAQSLDDFLFEHEILDDRERDRDFFVAARALSRLVEAPGDRRPVELHTVAGRVRKFLDDRHGRWTKRVERLAAPFMPSRWPEVRDKRPFHAAIAEVERLDPAANSDAKARASQLAVLSRAVVDYRAWLEELEAKEDKMREEADHQRQEGLASARDQLLELQKRQGEVSAAVDRAPERPKDELESVWPTVRMKQNANAKDTHRLEGQLRSLSPNAGSRLQAAASAMEASNAAGSDGDFAAAESNADLAGRLLRQAESAAQQSQQKRRSRGRRRMVSGDNYYGQSVVGGDVEIKRDYQVDRRYREDILDEVQASKYDDDNRAILDSYLRQVVR